MLQFAICQIIKVQNDLFGRSRGGERVLSYFIGTNGLSAGCVQQVVDCEWDGDTADEGRFEEMK